MKRLSQIVSTLGLMALAAGLIALPGTGPDGAAVWRWHWPIAGLAACVACFAVAARIAPRDGGPPR